LPGKTRTRSALPAPPHHVRFDTSHRPQISRTPGSSPDTIPTTRKPTTTQDFTVKDPTREKRSSAANIRGETVPSAVENPTCNSPRGAVHVGKPVTSERPHRPIVAVFVPLLPRCCRAERRPGNQGRAAATVHRPITVYAIVSAQAPAPKRGIAIAAKIKTQTRSRLDHKNA